MIRVDWNTFNNDCSVLAERILASGRAYDKLVAVARGGVFVGGLLAHFLEMRNITTVSLKLYEFRDRLEVVEELSSPDLPPPGSRLLVVDDLLDSGRTLAYIMDKWGREYNIDIAVLYDKGGGALRPAFVAKTIPNDWVYFPWEQDKKTSATDR